MFTLFMRRFTSSELYVATIPDHYLPWDLSEMGSSRTTAEGERSLEEPREKDCYLKGARISRIKFIIFRPVS